MSDPVTQTQFFEEMRKLDVRLQEGFASLRQELKDHAAEDRIVADRVLVIETQRADEAKAALRRGTWAGILAGAGVSGAIAAVKAWWR